MMSKIKDFIENFYGALIVLIIWYLISLDNNTRLFLPTPSETFSEFIKIAQESQYYRDIYFTLLQTSIAFVLSAIIGISLGFVLSSSKTILKISEPVIEFFRAIPSTSIFPLFLLIFGIGIQSRIITAVFVCIWVIIISTVYGMKHTSKERAKAIKMLGGNSIDSYLHVSIYETLPFILSSLRLTISLSLIIIILTEMLISPRYGIGVRIFELQQYFKVPSLYVYLLTIGYIGYFINKLFVMIEQKLAHWTNK